MTEIVVTGHEERASVVIERDRKGGVLSSKSIPVTSSGDPPRNRTLDTDLYFLYLSIILAD